MDNKETLKTLHNFQCWRRGKDMEMPNPKDIGLAIDNAIRLLRKENRVNQENFKIIMKAQVEVKKSMGLKPPYMIRIDKGDYDSSYSRVKSFFSSEQEMIKFLEQNNIEI